MDFADVPEWIGPKQVELIMKAKAQMPTGWQITTIETEGGIIIDIPYKEFEALELFLRIHVARVTNELCENLKKSGVPCFIQKA